ncbi:MAG: hypothetical protein Q4G05_01705 [Clostridia bacterium]|nr:hypothetical protein [Clostridia bacterium]
MGYRSDVRIMTSKNGFKKLNEFVSENIKKNKNEYSNLLEDIDVKKETSRACYFGWNYVKWYEDFNPEVIAIMSGLRHLEEEDYSFRYSRIGESYDDYEEFYHDSDKDSEQDLDFPSMIREFDDEYIIFNMDKDVEL